MASVALVAGVKPDAVAVAVDTDHRVLSTTATALPGLPGALYRLLEQRAAGDAPNWTVRISPPRDALLPPLSIVGGVIGDNALGLAAWASQRDARVLLVDGGTREQRVAVAAGVGDRGGKAAAGVAGGRLRFEWAAADEAPADPVRSTAKDQPRGR